MPSHTKPLGLGLRATPYLENMHSNATHTKTIKTTDKPRQTLATQARRNKAKAWARTDKRTAWE